MSVPLMKQADELRPQVRLCRVAGRRLGFGHVELLRHYAWRADTKRGSSHWTTARIAAELGVCERQVQRMKRDLEQLGLVTVEAGGGRLLGCKKSRDGHFTGRANIVFPQLDRVTFATLNDPGYPDISVTQTKAHTPTQTTPRSTLRKTTEVEIGRKAERGMRIASAAASAPADVSQAPRDPSRQPAQARVLQSQAPFGPSGDGSPRGAATQVEDFGKPKSVQSTSDARCFDCRRPITVFGGGHDRGCRYYGYGPLVDKCAGCGEIIDLLKHRGYHLPTCPLKARPQGLFGPVDREQGRRSGRAGRPKPRGAVRA